MKQLIIALVLCFVCVGCADINPLETTTQLCARGTSGFWFGLWNGLTVPFSFIGSLFDSNIEVFDVCNNGNWYSFGFWLGVGGLGGSGASASHSRY